MMTSSYVSAADQLEAWSQPTPLAVGQTANLSCTVTFGGPVVDETSPADTLGMFPQLTMTLGGREHPLTLSATRHDPGKPGSQKHRLTVVRICVVLATGIST